MENELGPASPDLLAELRRRWPLAAAVVVLCAALVALLAGLLQPSATATASLVVSDPRAESIYGGGATDRNYVANQVAVLQLRSTSVRAVELLPSEGAKALLSADRLVDELAVETPGESGLITVSFSDASPELAQQAVNSVLAAYRDVLADSARRVRDETLRSIDAALTQLDTQIAARDGQVSQTLLDSRDQLVQRRVEVAVGSGSANGILVADEASLPVASRPLSRPVAGLLGGVLGVLPAVALVYILGLSQRRFSDRYAPEELLGERLLSDVPDFRAERLPSDVPALDSPDSAAAEAFRFAATLLAIRQADAGSRVLAVVSGASQDGKTTVCANLAVTAALAGRKVLAVDGDLDGRGLSFLLLGDDHRQRGLVDVVAGRAELAAVVRHVPLQGGRQLDVLTGGSARDGAAGLLSDPRLQQLLTSCAVQYDLVLLDVPPVLQVAYAASLVRAADATVVVVPHESPEDRLTDLAERLELLQVPALGYAYNRAPLRSELGQHSQLVTDDGRRPAAPAADPRPAGSARPARSGAPASSRSAGRRPA